MNRTAALAKLEARGLGDSALARALRDNGEDSGYQFNSSV
jgi:hypothetical protein